MLMSAEVLEELAKLGVDNGYQHQEQNRKAAMSHHFVEMLVQSTLNELLCIPSLLDVGRPGGDSLAIRRRRGRLAYISQPRQII